MKIQQLITLSGIAFLLVNATVNAQSIQETTVKFDKNNVNAIVAEYKRPESVMEDALKAQVDKEGFGKYDKKKGYWSYINIHWKRTGNLSLDIYFKVDGNKSKSTITVLVSKGYNNFTSSATDPEIINTVREFLKDLESTATDVQFALDVKAQQEMVADAEKRYNNAISDSTDLVNQKQKLENKIVQQSSEVQSKRQELEQHKQKLDGMKQ
ncbi:hypothetical protein F0919_13695 [Taibaiella lutea]|uniref:DUF4468 domain-containing protein n=1 Tax=Taibaiella lutea TaxID=2608001 RepID=A0A5M6CEH3_9BACT|nr:hypothetical protein [Taibaiella lutea]KAA5533588.1 hypothetical protein F0919_13695 [Taibaiella lutea]